MPESQYQLDKSCNGSASERRSSQYIHGQSTGLAAWGMATEILKPQNHYCR